MEGGESGRCREREKGSLGHTSLELFLLSCFREAPDTTLRQEGGKGESEVALQLGGRWSEKTVFESDLILWDWPCGPQEVNQTLCFSTSLVLGPLDGWHSGPTSQPTKIPFPQPSPLVLLYCSV